MRFADLWIVQWVNRLRVRATVRDWVSIRVVCIKICILTHYMIHIPHFTHGHSLSTQRLHRYSEVSALYKLVLMVKELWNFSYEFQADHAFLARREC